MMMTHCKAYIYFNELRKCKQVNFLDGLGQVQVNRQHMNHTKYMTQTANQPTTLPIYIDIKSTNISIQLQHHPTNEWTNERHHRKCKQKTKETRASYAFCLFLEEVKRLQTKSCCRRLVACMHLWSNDECISETYY